MGEQGGGQQQTTTEPWSEQKKYLQGTIFPEAQEIYRQGPQEFFPGSTTAGFTQPEQQAQQGALNRADQFQQQTAPQIQQAQEFGLNAPMNVAQNPVYQDAISSALQPITQNFQRNVLPALDSNAVSAGQAGSSRHGVVQANATNDLNQTLSNTSAGMMSNFMGQGMQQQAQMMQMLPQTESVLQTPIRLRGAVGEQQRAMDQSEIDEAMARHQWGQDADYQNLSRFRNMIAGNFGGTTTQPGMQGPGALSRTLGGGLSGFAATGNPWGAAAGAAAGYASG